MFNPFHTGAGVIGDISVPAERGGFFGIFTLGPMVCLVLLGHAWFIDMRSLGWACCRSGDWGCAVR